MLNLLYVTLKALTNPSIPNELVRYVYELRMIAINGECPDFFSCQACGAQEGLDMYSYTYNGVFCAACHTKVRDGISLNSSTLYTLQYIVTAPLGRLYTFVVTDEVMTELKMVTSRIEVVTFDKKFKSKEMLAL